MRKAQEVIEKLVEDNGRAAERAIHVAQHFEAYDQALRAEARLPGRRAEWVTWARERAKRARALARKLRLFIEEDPPK